MLHVQLLYVCVAVDFQILPVYNEMKMGRKNKSSLSETIGFIYLLKY